ncbi:Long-chain fatty acid transport protein precursor [Marinomonas aquimarina]|uniref:Long-chain fatty acid transport protein n=1 Tax=Marinomonas aquimarina TaxID=295068 RepID=A0A1A8T0F9_9GAMM|nr:outer membrane protein transport protein [Marinomonas aquimarina]SBS24577.1 Long-chain fatty acid transport protein precursor [Marinomonas aquimarina]
MIVSFLYKRTLIASTIALSAIQLHAAGFQLNAQSATGLGRAFAGDAAIGDNASIIARNPAGMSLFDRPALSVGVETITTDIEVKDATYVNNLSASSASANTDNIGDTSVVPSFYYIHPVNDKFAWGVNAYSNFGTKTKFDNGYAGYEYGGKTDVTSANFGVVGSYKVSEQLTLGAGIDAVYGEGTFTRPANPAIAGVYGIDNVLEIEADGWGFGYNLGLLFELDQQHRFGLDYHFSPDIDADGEVYRFGATATKQSDTVIMPLPDIAEFSGYHRLAPEYALHYSIQFIRWSEFKTLSANNAGTINTYNWQDAWHYSIGGTYYMDNQWELRAGYLYDTSAQAQRRSISVPDSDRQWLSAGVTYKPDDQSSIDFGATYLIGEDVAVMESNSASSISGTTHADALLLGLQYSRSF